MKKINEELLIQALEENFIANLLSLAFSQKSFQSDIVDIKKDLKKRTANVQSVESLIDEYKDRAKLSDKEIEKNVGIKDFGSFVKNLDYDKVKLAKVSICLQLSYKEAMDLFVAASIYLNKKENTFDCVYDYYMNNYSKAQNPQDNLDEFERVLDYSNEYVKKRMKDMWK